jgi:hypothetical protein
MLGYILLIALAVGLVKLNRRYRGSAGGDVNMAAMLLNMRRKEQEALQRKQRQQVRGFFACKFPKVIHRRGPCATCGAAWDAPCEPTPHPQVFRS